MNDASSTWSPRYVNYARVHGRTPDEMLDADRVRFPGGRMAGFISWSRARMRAFYAAHPEAFRASPGGIPRLVDHAAYDAYLDALPVLPVEATP